MIFEIDHLETYDDQSLLDELRRVAALINTPKLTIAQFSAVAKVHSSTLEKRFKGWRNALVAAGLSDRIDGSNLSRSRDELLVAIKESIENSGKSTLTLSEFTAHTGITGGPVRRVFGSWKEALSACGLEQSPLGKRYTDEQCFENMLALWMHFGRPPQHDEMNRHPSQVGAKAYVRRWGTWRKALQAFVQRVNGGEASPLALQEAEQSNIPDSPKVDRGPRDIPLSLRYFVLKRDNFRCITCGTSPAINLGVVLHIDHIYPWSLGGATVADNLRTLCSLCNLGKGATPE